MNRMNWCVANLLAGLLETAEREASLGDLIESRPTGCNAVRDLLGLVVRRQAALWKTPRWYLVFLGLIAPLGLILSLLVKRTAGGTAVYAWLYLNNWTPGYLSIGFRQDLFHCVAGFCASYLALSCCAWTGGFILGSLSRRTIGLTGLIFLVVSLAGEVLVAPDDHLAVHDAVFSLTFYRAVLPLLLLAGLALLPAFKGMHDGLYLDRFPLRLQQMIWLCLAATMVTLLVAALRPRWDLGSCSIAAIGPVGYVLALAGSRRRRPSLSPTF